MIAYKVSFTVSSFAQVCHTLDILWPFVASGEYQFGCIYTLSVFYLIFYCQRCRTTNVIEFIKLKIIIQFSHSLTETEETGNLLTWKYRDLDDVVQLHIISVLFGYV